MNYQNQNCEIFNKIESLPYDLKILIFKIYILKNPEFIFDIYFNINELQETKIINYSSFNEGTYSKEKIYFSLYKLLIQYKLFQKNFKDIPLFYKNKNEEGDRILWSLGDFINKLLDDSKKKYENYKLRKKYLGDMYYSFKEVISLDLYDEDFYNEGYDNWGELAFLIDNNDTWIKTYINYNYEYNIPFYINYRF